MITPLALVLLGSSIRGSSDFRAALTGSQPVLYALPIIPPDPRSSLVVLSGRLVSGGVYKTVSSVAITMSAISTT